MNTTAAAQKPHPLLIGLRAARANIVPGLIVQAVAVILVGAYYFYPPARGGFEQLALLKQRWGFAFSAISGILAGAVLPEILTVLVFQRGRVKRENWERMLFAACYWGSQSMVVDAFYRLQAELFGPQVDWPTVAKKVFVDQFVYTAFYASPMTMACFEWRNNHYRFEGMSRVLTWRFFKNVVFPATVANWGVWIPVVCLVYVLPPLLQLPLFSLTLTFWSMLILWMTRR